MNALLKEWQWMVCAKRSQVFPDTSTYCAHSLLYCKTLTFDPFSFGGAQSRSKMPRKPSATVMHVHLLLVVSVLTARPTKECRSITVPTGFGDDAWL
eukprot:scaffold1440_cov332-Pavlova_lutheri.AAC.8